MSINRRWRRMAGISMIELIFFIVIVSVAVAGVLSVLNVTVKSSADPQQRKQALAIAEALLEEVEMMPFTFCDPDDSNAATATSSNNCTGGTGGANDQGTLTHQSGEVRGDLATPYDNVADYNGFTIVGGDANSTDIGGVVAVPAGYTAQVGIVQEAFGPANPPAAQVPATAALRITVTVSYNGGADSIALEGYRTRYAPNFTP